MLSAQQKVGAEALIILDITKTESNNCFIIHCFEENKDKNSITCTPRAEATFSLFLLSDVLVLFQVFRWWQAR